MYHPKLTSLLNLSPYAIYFTCMENTVMNEMKSILFYDFLLNKKESFYAIVKLFPLGFEPQICILLVEGSTTELLVLVACVTCHEINVHQIQINQLHVHITADLLYD